MKKFLYRHSFMALPFLLGLVFLVGASSVKAITLYGVTTTNQLVRFDSATPGTVITVGAITGLQSGENVLGIDFRPATGQLFALGSTSRIYRLNITTAIASAVGAPFTPALSGTDFGFDFNPTVDRIRIVSNTGQNLRGNPNDGTVIMDGTLNPGTPSVTAAAYTNSVPNATTTILYVIDSNTNQLFQQTPANAGTLVLVGPLGVDPTGSNGFDHLASNSTAYAALTVGGASRLYTINLMTGAATSVGAIGTGAFTLRGLAAQSNTPGGPPVGNRTVLDFDGDRITDYTVFRPSNSTWFIRNSTNGSIRSVMFGTTATDVFTPGDYDGDGRTDISVWRTTNQIYYTLRSSDNTLATLPYGLPGDEPVNRDYDGDGITDYAVVRRTNGQLIWFYRSSISGNTVGQQFGLANDIVAPGDYDGDGRFDLAVRRGTGNQPATYYVQQSTAGFRAVQFGLNGDAITPGDYDGDGKTDFTAVRQGSLYFWLILQSSDNSFVGVQWGAKPMFTAQGDYNGDGKTDITVWDPTTGTFYVHPLPGTNVFQFQFGQNGDYPVANYDTH